MRHVPAYTLRKGDMLLTRGKRVLNVKTFGKRTDVLVKAPDQTRTLVQFRATELVAIQRKGEKNARSAQSSAPHVQARQARSVASP